MEEAVQAHLLGASGLTALVSQRVYYGRRAQGSALPSVVFHRIGGGRDYVMSGPTGLVQTRVQIDCWGETYSAGKLVSRQVNARLSGLRETISGIQFQGAFLDSERDYSETGSGAAEYLYRTSLDFLIWHTE